MKSVRAVVPLWAASRAFTLGAAALLALRADASVTAPWRGWDAGWFLDIAANGYDVEPQGTAFYPLYPAVLRLGGELLDGRPALAAFLLSFPLTLAAFALLHALARRLVDELTAMRAVAYLAFFPYAFFLHAVYSEALFLVVAIGAFLAAERGKVVLAGVLAGGALLTRPVGFALLAGIAVLVWSRDGAPEVRKLAAAPLLFMLFPVALAAYGHSPLAFASGEEHWRELGPVAWLHGASRALRGAADGAPDVLAALPSVPVGALMFVTQLAALALFGALSLLAWRRLGAGYGVYGLLSLAMPVSAPADPWPYVSLERFALALFPCFVALATLPLGTRGHRALLIASAAAQVGVVSVWVRGEFIA